MYNCILNITLKFIMTDPELIAIISATSHAFM